MSASTNMIRDRVINFANDSGITIEDVCEKSQIGLHVFDNGNPSWSKLCQLCKSFPDLSAEYLLRGEMPSMRIPTANEIVSASDLLTDRIDAYRQNVGMTKAALLKSTGLKNDVIKNRMNRQTGKMSHANMTFANLVKLCIALPNISAEYILRGEGSPVRNVTPQANMFDSIPYNAQLEESYSSIVSEYIASRSNSEEGPNLADLVISAMQETIRTQRELIESLQSQLSLIS